MKNNLMITAIVTIIVGGLSFWGGMQYQQANTQSTGRERQFGSLNGQERPEGFPDGTAPGSKTGTAPVSGEILNLDNQTMTVQTAAGDSKIIIYSGSTNVNKTAEGSTADLKVGEKVMIIGTSDSDGTVTAQTISVGGGGWRGLPGEQPPTDNN
jgi:hypothetical protein